MTTYWFVFNWGDIEPDVAGGPFATDEERDAAAQEYYRENQRGDDEHGCFWLDVTDGVPKIGAYAGWFLDQDYAEDGDDD